MAANATQYNFLGDHAEAKRDQAREEFKETNGIGAARQLVELEGADQRSDNLLAKYRLDKSSLSAMELAELNAYVQVYTYDMALKYGEDVARVLANALIQNGPDSVGIYPYAGTTDAKNAFADALRAQAGGLFDQLAWVRPKSENELVYKDAQGYLQINNEQQGLSNLGSPALYGLTGSLGAGIRIAAAANGVLQAGYGVDQAFNGDLWNAAGNIVVGALGVASVRVPSTRLPNGSGVGELPVVNPNTGSTLVKEVGQVFDRTTVGAKVTEVALNKLPVPNDLPMNIHMGQQGKHMRGNNNFIEGRSYFNDGIDPAELLAGVHNGKYSIVETGSRGNPIVEFGRPIGVDGRTGQTVTRGQIHYGKNGAHIVPDARK